MSDYTPPRPYPPAAPDSDARLYAESAATALEPAEVEAGVPAAAPDPSAEPAPQSPPAAA